MAVGLRPLVWYEGASLATRRSLRADHQGSVIAVADASGTSIATDTYDAWGIPGTANIGRFQYTGQAWIPELRLYHYKARAYSATLGRFMQIDPVGYDGGNNIYAYTGNDPVNGRDPNGLQMAQIARACAGEQGIICAGLGLIGAIVVEAGVQQEITVNHHVNSISSMAISQTDTRARSTLTQSPTSTKNRRPEAYVVRVQIQGTQVGGNNSKPLTGEIPISGGEVKGAVNGLLGNLTSQQQRDAMPAVTGAFKAVDRQIANGGLDAGFQIRGLIKDFSPNQVRVDIDIIKGKNIQY